MADDVSVSVLLNSIVGQMLPEQTPKSGKKEEKEVVNKKTILDTSVLTSLVLHGVELMIAGEAHAIMEVEFYLTNDCHPDPFTHCDVLQVLFYFIF
jgi:hypothetical protein